MPHNLNNDAGVLDLGEVGTAYHRCRDRLNDLLAPLDERDAKRAVPACPGWSVHDVLAHVSGGFADALAGRMEGAGTDAWTARQVTDRRNLSLGQILTEWNDNAPKVEPLLDGAGLIGRQAVADVVNHEHDIRGALGVPGERDTDAVRIALAFAADRLVESAEERGVSLAVRVADGTRFGSADASVTLRGEPFELMRAITGRRSVTQLRTMHWDGDVDAAIPAFSWYSITPAADDVQD